MLCVYVSERKKKSKADIRGCNIILLPILFILDELLPCLFQPRKLIQNLVVYSKTWFSKTSSKNMWRVVIFATNVCNRKECPGRAPVICWLAGWIESVRQAKYFALFEMFLCRTNYGMKSLKHSTLRLPGLGSIALFWSSLLCIGNTLSFWDLELGFQDISLCKHSTNFLPTKKTANITVR